MKIKNIYLICIILTIGFFLRVNAAVNSPLIPDEYHSIVFTKMLQFQNVLDILRSSGHVSLLAYYFNWSSTFFGESKFGYRMLNVILGSMTMLVIYATTLLMFNSRSKAFLSMLLLSINSYHVVISSFALPEAVLLFLASISLYIFFKIIISRRTKLFYLLNLVFLVGFFCRETMFFILLFCYLYLFFNKKHRELVFCKNFMISAILTGIVFSIFFMYLLFSAGLGSFTAINKFSFIPQFSFAPLTFYFAFVQHQFFQPFSGNEYPLNNELFGVLVFSAVFTCFRFLKKEGIRFNVFLFSFVFFFFTFFAKGAGEFFWVDITIFSAIILVSSVLVDTYQISATYKKLHFILKLTIPITLIVLVLFAVKESFNNNGCRYSLIIPSQREALYNCLFFLSKGYDIYKPVVRMQPDTFRTSIYFNLSKPLWD
jgi:hypothetical protein